MGCEREKKALLLLSLWPFTVLQFQSLITQVSICAVGKHRHWAATFIVKRMGGRLVSHWVNYEEDERGVEEVADGDC